MNTRAMGGFVFGNDLVSKENLLSETPISVFSSQNRDANSAQAVRRRTNDLVHDRRMRPFY